MFIPDSDPDFLPIPDPGVKKAPDPGSSTLPSNLAPVCGIEEFMYFNPKNLVSKLWEI